MSDSRSKLSPGFRLFLLFVFCMAVIAPLAEPIGKWVGLKLSDYKAPENNTIAKPNQRDIDPKNDSKKEADNDLSKGF